MKQITLLVVDDHPIFRQGVVETLSMEPDMHVVAQATDGVEALELVKNLKPTVAILDVSIPGMNGQQITHHVTQERMPTRVLLMTGYDDVEQAIHAAIAGAAGFCSKDLEPQSLPRMIRDIVDGKYVFVKKVFT